MLDGVASAELPPLRYLTAADVRAAMPPLDERLALAEKTMVALLDENTELPPKLGIHLFPPGSFAHAMPAAMIGQSEGDVRYLAGMKWIAGSPWNRDRGLPALHGVILLVDPATGVPTAILDGAVITAERTAAVSGVALKVFGPPIGRPARVAVIGAGVQGQSHLAPIASVLSNAHLTIFDRHADRAEALAARARDTSQIASATTGASARDAIADADVIVTAVPFAAHDIRITSDWLAPNATLVAVDYDTCTTAELVANAALFVTDERYQFLRARDNGSFVSYPDPAMTLGEAIVNRVERPAGRVVVTHLGVGLADLVFADAIVRRAEADGIGLELPR
jgi:ornithine cyclodeaminase/alanine dehydrogenase-like protein (mu-crystallin family)